jgi:hypothetical protein
MLACLQRHHGRLHVVGQGAQANLCTARQRFTCRLPCQKRHPRLRSGHSACLVPTSDISEALSWCVLRYQRRDCTLQRLLQACGRQGCTERGQQLLVQRL